MAPEFKVEGEGIDQEALEAELARRVEARRRSGALSREVEALLAERLSDEAPLGGLAPLAELDYAAGRALASWEVSAAYPVETEKSRLLRPLIIFVKRIARLWARVAVGPIQREQTAFNRHAARGLDAVRREAVARRASELAAEQDLCDLAGAMLRGGEAAATAAAVADFLTGAGEVTVIGPCATPVLEALESSPLTVFRVSGGSAWDEGEPGGSTATLTAPLSFLGQLDEASRPAILVSELSFWLRPEALIALARRAYLVLSTGGRIAVAVQGFAQGGPGPAWCSDATVLKALSMAGFGDVAVVKPTESGGYVATARKP